MPDPVAAAVAGAVVSSASKPWCDEAAEIIKTQIAKLWCVDKRSERLKHKLQLLDCVLEDAEQKQFTSEPVRKWLRGFRDAAYDAEDVLDELATAEAIRRQRSKKRCVRKLLSRWARNYDVAGRIQKIVQKLDELAEEKGSLNLQTGASKGYIETVADRDTSSALGRNRFGRKEEKKAILRKLGWTEVPHEPESSSNPHEPESSSNPHDSSNPHEPESSSNPHEPESSSNPHEPEISSNPHEPESSSNPHEPESSSNPHEPESSSNPHEPEPESSSNPERGGEKVSLIPIVGLPGVGKTTLAQMVFNDKKLEQPKNLFSFKKWIRVSHDFEIPRLIADITGKTDLSKSTLEDARLALNETLEDHEFLIVLDDVWCEDKVKWRKFWDILCQAGKGGKVIVTTRSETVVSPVYNKTIEPLSPLSDEQCWLIFESVAFPNGNSEGHRTLREIGKQIVKERLKGIPLSAELVGSFLGDNLFETVWRSVLEDSSVWNQVDQQNSIMPILQLSYLYLPAPLRRCFAYCAIFPKDYEFDIPELIRLWMAQGFIQPQGNMGEEDTGRIYFNGLLHRSFFQQVGDDYVMHNLIHDLAEWISGGECLRIGESTDITRVDSERVRHVSFPVKHYISSSGPDRAAGWEYHGKFSKCRTFLNYIISLDRDMPKAAFGEMKFVRVLTLYLVGELKQFPDAIGDLMHLRYLHVRIWNYDSSPSCWEWPCKILPESVCKLHNLQTLTVDPEDAELPQGIRELVNLRYLQAAVQLAHRVSGVRSTSFWGSTPTPSSEWSSFVMGTTEKPRIGVLQNLRRLQGGLCVAGLENVKSGEHAKEANLKNMVGLRSLSLVWNFIIIKDKDSPYPRHYILNGIKTRDEDTLNGLELPQNIEKLQIFGNSGGAPPKWMMQPAQPFLGLVELSLFRCNNWEHLAPIGQLPRLKVLELTIMDKVKRVGWEFYGWKRPGEGTPTFPSLEVLIFQDMVKWEAWEDVVLPSLCKLRLFNCPKLRKLPCNAGWKSLVSLDTSGCHGQQSFWGDGLPPALKELIIAGSHDLTSLPADLNRLSSLEVLRIRGCRQIDALQGLPPSLKELFFSDCPRLDRDKIAAEYPSLTIFFG